MNRDEAYKILYHQEGPLLVGSCNHSEEIIDILSDIILCEHVQFARNGQKIVSNWRLDEVDRWNIYNPDSLHIVYTVEVADPGYDDNFNDEKSTFQSREVIVPIGKFASRWRDKQLKSIGV